MNKRLSLSTLLALTVALKFFALGCLSVQVGTAQMRDPFAAARIARDLVRAQS